MTIDNINRRIFKNNITSINFTNYFINRTWKTLGSSPFQFFFNHRVKIERNIRSKLVTQNITSTNFTNYFINRTWKTLGSFSLSIPIQSSCQDRTKHQIETSNTKHNLYKLYQLLYQSCRNHQIETSQIITNRRGLRDSRWQWQCFSSIHKVRTRDISERIKSDKTSRLKIRNQFNRFSKPPP